MLLAHDVEDPEEICVDKYDNLIKVLYLACDCILVYLHLIVRKNDEACAKKYLDDLLFESCLDYYYNYYEPESSYNED